MEQIPNNCRGSLLQVFKYNISLWHMCVFKAFYAACFCYFSGKVSRKSHACSCGHLKLFKGREKNIGCSQHAYPGNVFWSIIICIIHHVAGLPSHIFWVCDLSFSLSSIFCKIRFFFCVVGATSLPGTRAQGLGLFFEKFLIFFPYRHNYQIFSNSWVFPLAMGFYVVLAGFEFTL